MKDEKDRLKPGRKAVDDKKLPLTIYVQESILLSMGGGFLLTGKDKAKVVALNAIQDHVSRETSK